MHENPIPASSAQYSKSSIPTFPSSFITQLPYTMAPGIKRPSRSPSPTRRPPPHRAKHKRKQETEQEEEVEAKKALVKGKYPSGDDDDPALETSKEAKRRLFSLPNPSRIDENALSRLKFLLLEASDDHESTPNKLNLSEIVASIFQTERWRELLDNLTNAIHANTERRQETALRVILSLPEKECLLCLPRARKFWSDNYGSIYTRFFRKNCIGVLNLFDSPNLNIQAFTFDASVKFICLLPHLRFDLLLSKMVGWLQQAFRRGGQIDIVKPRIMDLVQVAGNYTHDFAKSLRSELMTCMFEIAETADDNFLTCPAIEIIILLQRRSSLDFTRFVRELSKESNHRILENCVRLMFHIADVPSWYDMDKKSNKYLGISGNFRLGKLLLLEFCLDSKEDILVPFLSEKIPQYLNSEDWQTRHAGVIAFAIISRACGPEKIREQTERVVDVSLADPHPRVHWAAIEALLSSASDHQKEHVKYLIKFLPRLITIIRSSASVYPRVQFHATRAMRHLINYCDHEDDVSLFSEDLVPELLKFLKNFRDEAIEILRSLAVSFPVVFREHYQETVDSLKPLVSRSLLGVKCIESLSYIFSRFLTEPSLFLPSNAEEVFTIMFKILDDWTDTDDIIQIHILKALSQLCKLPQTKEFLNKTMPVFIQILKNTKNPPITTLAIDKEQIPSCPEQRILACDLLSNFAVRFQEQFAPWASRVSPLLTSLFWSTDDDDAEDDDNCHVTAAVKISSVKALPSVLLSCLHRGETQLINSAVQALVSASQMELKRAIDIEMLKSLNVCIAMSGSVFNVDVIKQIADLIQYQLSQDSCFVNLEQVTDYEMEQEEEIIQAAKCLKTMINTLKSAFLPHVDELLPAVEALWRPDNEYPDKVKEVAISIFNLLLKDYPYKLQSYHDTYPRVVMDFCESESPQLHREAARGIGLCATHRILISNFDALEAINKLYHVIERAVESEGRVTYDAAVSALGKICEFRHDTINGPEVVPIWLNFLPLRNDYKEAKYAHQQLCLLLEKADPDLLGLNNENVKKITHILREILLQSEYLATEETTCSIICFLTQFGDIP